MQEHARHGRVIAEALTAEAANARALSTPAPSPVAIISQLKYLCTTRTHANEANHIMHACKRSKPHHAHLHDTHHQAHEPR
jgi:hypothetical protein